MGDKKESEAQAQEESGWPSSSGRLADRAGPWPGSQPFSGPGSRALRAPALPRDAPRRVRNEGTSRGSEGVAQQLGPGLGARRGNSCAGSFVGPGTSLVMASGWRILPGRGLGRGAGLAPHLGRASSQRHGRAENVTACAPSSRSGRGPKPRLGAGTGQRPGGGTERSGTRWEPSEGRPHPNSPGEALGRDCEGHRFLT